MGSCSFDSGSVGVVSAGVGRRSLLLLCEMAKHKSFTVDTKVKVYFCDPQSPWQRGTNENTNGLLRQYFPKKTDLSGYAQADLNKVALRLNQRPRKTLGFETPASKLQASVASTS
jgi:IS30 family transposase